MTHAKPAADLPLALTQGDPAGIGPEITLAAWLRRQERDLPAFLVIADAELMRRSVVRAGLAVPVVETTPEEARRVFATALPVVPIGQGVDVMPGRPDPGTAASTIRSIEAAVELVVAGRAGAIVTNPISKRVLYAADFRHPGHTEFLAALAAPAGSVPSRPVMMIWSETLAVVPVTIHVPLKDVPGLLTVDLICDTARIVDRDLRRRFGIERPRLALAGLNPHAGEGGTIGAEDDATIAPAIARLRAEGLVAEGPFPADTLFHPRARAGYDAALAMYHDQALIPIKTIAFDEGVNVTLGLPFVRTSPDHGTAFDIAGRGVARPDSLIAALRLAGRLARTSGAPAAA